MSRWASTPPSRAATREHGNSYLAILEGVGLLGVLPFMTLVVMLALKLGNPVEGERASALKANTIPL